VAQDAARRALTLVEAREHDDAAAAEAGLNARHVLCQILGRRLSGQAQSKPVMAEVHDATDLADEGLDLVRAWQQRGVERFRNLATDLFRFGARVYAHYQPHFLHEFVSEQLPTQRGDNLNTHSVVPPGGLEISGVRPDEPGVWMPPPA